MWHPLASVEWYASHEGMAPVERVVAVAVEMAAGDYAPRWLSAAFHGHGLPFFEFYAPAAYWLAGLLHFAGLSAPAALKAVLLAASFAGGAGMLAWIGPRLGRTAALAGATLYVAAPYAGYDVFIRGAYAEAVALGLLPWLFAGLDRCAGPRPGRGIVLASVAAAAIVLSHNLSALMIVPLALAYAAWLALGAGLQLPARFAGAGLLAAGLSAFYWLPLIVEAEYLRPLAERLTEGPFHFSRHFLDLARWALAGDETAPGAGLALTTAAVAGLALAWRLAAAPRRFALVVGGLALAAALLTLPLASTLYATLPGLAFVQFPWRFLGPASLFLAALGATVAAAAAPRWQRPAALAVGLAALLLAPAPRLVETPLPAAYGRDESVVAQRLVGRLSMRDEFLPRWAAGIAAPLRIVSDDPTVAIGRVEQAGHRLHFGAVLPRPGWVEVPFHYFPGWQARRAGGPVPLKASPRGFLLVGLPPGAHQVDLWFGSTPPRTMGGWISGVSLALLLLGMIGLRRRRDGGVNRPSPAAPR